jgi:hypothetical protein
VGSSKIDFVDATTTSVPDGSQIARVADESPSPPMPTDASSFVQVPLIALCIGRSGDKGDVCNIGIMCRRPEYFTLVKQQLTAEAVQKYMKHLVFGKVVRYELPGTSAFNFVCTRALGGGGLNSMNMDRQGKCYAQMLLDFPVKVPLSAISTSAKL